MLANDPYRYALGLEVTICSIKRDRVAIALIVNDYAALKWVCGKVLSSRGGNKSSFTRATI